jgi:hypothetical protein
MHRGIVKLNIKKPSVTVNSDELKYSDSKNEELEIE